MASSFQEPLTSYTTNMDFNYPIRYMTMSYVEQNDIYFMLTWYISG